VEIFIFSALILRLVHFLIKQIHHQNRLDFVVNTSSVFNAYNFRILYAGNQPGLVLLLQRIYIKITAYPISNIPANKQFRIVVSGNISDIRPIQSHNICGILLLPKNLPFMIFILL